MALRLAVVLGLICAVLVLDAIYSHLTRSDLVERIESIHPAGRWREIALSDNQFTDEQKAMLEAAKTLGYLHGTVPTSDAVGVTIYDTTRAFRGLNLYCSGHGPEAHLLDMYGNALHSWEMPIESIAPGFRSEPDAMVRFWLKVHLLEHGCLLVLFDSCVLAKIDKDSNPIWVSEGPAHHDIEPDGKGRIWSLRWVNMGLVTAPGERPKPVAADYVIAFDENTGNTVFAMSLLLSFLKSTNSDVADLLQSREMYYEGDVFHTNSIRLVSDNHVLLSIRNLDTLVEIDYLTGEIVWAHQGLAAFRGQHDASRLSNGHTLVFNNNWCIYEELPEESSVLEFDEDMRVVWRYPKTPNSSFYSKTCGAVQRLPNGNTLITESNRGRVIEVTPMHEIVWEYRSPHRAGENNELVATLFEMERVPAQDWLLEGYEAVSYERMSRHEMQARVDMSPDRKLKGPAIKEPLLQRNR